jgi:hypothetical protein
MATCICSSNKLLRNGRSSRALAALLTCALALLGAFCSGAPEPPEGSIGKSAANRVQEREQLRTQFDSSYAGLEAKLKDARNPQPYSSSRYDGPPKAELWNYYPDYRTLWGLGPAAVPFMVEKIAAGSNPPWISGVVLADLVKEMTKVRLAPNADLIAWWKSRGEVSAKFDKAYAQWKQAKAKEPSFLQIEETVFDDDKKIIEIKMKKTVLGQAYDAMRDLGIDGLPLAMERIKKGDHDLLPLVRELTDGAGDTVSGTLEERVAATLDWWTSQERKWTLPPVSAAKLKDPKP